MQFDFYFSEPKDLSEIKAAGLSIKYLDKNKEDLRQIEINAERVLALLLKSTLEHTRNCIQIDYGRKEGTTILVTAEAIGLRLPTVEWTMGSYSPAL